MKSKIFTATAIAGWLILLIVILDAIVFNGQLIIRLCNAII